MTGDAHAQSICKWSAIQSVDRVFSKDTETISPERERRVLSRVVSLFDAEFDLRAHIVVLRHPKIPVRVELVVPHILPRIVCA
tara:strand:+ start:484 stop:732 length:249 start_codon:yes stop_codon:yes gene_type:complete